jgi:azurin
MRFFTILVLAFFVAKTSHAASEVSVEIGVLQLRYTKSTFHAAPGSKVTITFENRDELAHNLVVCKGGEDSWKTLADAALKLGEAGADKGWLPESDLIVAATRMLAPHEKQTITFDAPDADGIYPYVCTFPGHSLLMRGEMIVSKFPRGIGDLRYSYYEGSWGKLPDFSKLKPVAVGKIEDNKITIAPRKRNDAFGFVFEGDLAVPLDGDYYFTTSSDDGSTLLVDGKLVVDNDGAHSSRQAAGRIHLTQGSHRLEVRYFEGSVTEELAVAWSGPGFKMAPLSATESASFERAAEFQPVVFDKAKVVRVRLPDASPRSMAVGLPGGVNFCFDAGSCSVRYAWIGGFVDVAPERGNGTGRGGAVCRPLGSLFGKSSPLAPVEEGSPEFRFRGYRTDATAVEFRFTVDGVEVRQRVTASPSGRGLAYQFTPENLPEEVKNALADRLTAPLAPEK